MPSPEGRVYIIPALLESTPKQHQYMPSDSDQALLFSFPDEYFPESIMNHILAKTINWSVSEGYSIQEYVLVAKQTCNLKLYSDLQILHQTHNSAPCI